MNPKPSQRLSAIFAPEVVGVPPTNAIHELMQLPDGELRHYGFRGTIAGGIRHVFLSSRDNGISWTEHDSPANSPGATVCSPWSGEYLTVLCTHGCLSLEEFQGIHASCPEPGIYVHRSANGPDGPFVSTRIGDLLPRLLICRQPLPLRSRRRWVLPCHAGIEAPERQGAVVFLSDDDGHSWRHVALPPVPAFGVCPPHQGARWENCGAEPTIAELSDGCLYMLIRTAHDVFWESFSSDGGESWSAPAPSRFYGTITTPLLFKLSDGRLLAVWNNTTPLPEQDHRQQAGLTDDERNGVWEDVFTNRDALHAAVSMDDGATWKGFRELHLNQCRNDADFRSSGGNDPSLDKSIHQSQAIELPGGKILLAFGQHADCRRMLIFDPDWLLEKGRHENFRLGLGGWSYHQYLKSVPGGYRGFTGHCSMNRRPGAALVPHPDGDMREVLQIARHPDPRLLEEREGAVWNFPASHSGTLCLRIRLPKGSKGGRICLLDRWFNPVDTTADRFAQFVIHLRTDLEGGEGIKLPPDQWQDLTFRWNLGGTPAATCQIGDDAPLILVQNFPCHDGISYLHLQSVADSPDPLGILLESVEKCRDPRVML